MILTTLDKSAGAAGLPESITDDFSLWYKFNEPSGATTVINYSQAGTARDGTVVEGTGQTIDFDGTGLLWGPASSDPDRCRVDIPAFDINESGDPDTVSVFTVFQWDGDTVPSQSRSVLMDQVGVNGQYGLYYNIGTGIIRVVSRNIVFVADTQPADFTFSASTWYLVNYRRTGSGSNHHMRINKGPRVLTTNAQSFVTDNKAKELGQIQGGAQSFIHTGYIAYMIIVKRDLTTAEEQEVEDFIYSEMSARGVDLVDM